MGRINPLVAGRRNRAALTQLTERPHGRTGRPQPGVRVRQPMMQRTDEILDAALACAEARWSVVPIAPRGKQPLLPWLEFQQRRALPAEIHDGFRRCPAANLAVVPGANSHIVVIELAPPPGGDTPPP